MRAFRIPPPLLLGCALGLVLALLLRDCAGGSGGDGGTRAVPPAGADARPHAGETAAVPALWPPPREVRDDRGSVAIGRSVAVRAGDATDPATLDVVVRALRAGGAREIRVGDEPRPGELLVVTDGTTAGLDAGSPKGLPEGGYVLAVGHAGGAPRVALAGADRTGAFHAAQTFAQLVRPVGAAAARTALPAVRIRDWPATATRGIVEGFYGTPWTHRERLAQLDFAARWKLNTYLYSPKDDPYLRSRWREPYPESRLTALRALARYAAARHVSFVYALSPGPSVCYSSAADRAALLRKFRQLWDVGVRSYAVPLDDIDITRWNCRADATVYGHGRAAVARAQADLLNEVQRGFLAPRPQAGPLITVPTEYDGTRATDYTTALASALAPGIAVMWTGPLVVSPTLRADQAREAARRYGHPVVVWDNYPVNDYTPGTLLLGPYAGRDPGVPGAVAGVTANPMNQATASVPALFSVAAYAWHPRAYRPAAALDAGLRVLAAGDGRALTALRAFADLNHASRLDSTPAPKLAALIEDYRRGAPDARDALRGHLDILAAAPDTVPPAVRASVAPWLDATRDWARAALAALDLRDGTGTRAQVRALRDAARSHTVTDWQGRPRTVEVGAGVLDAFVARALEAP
ncbi:beta-N-acetylhexosaminidase family protein [Streptomyces chromofuscus]|uniref:Beta-N-acetylglucosaminidase domain-containing protein n=1 Tax=Streptomyces chromofuscus TaxID=42881 RepID=A0A7M2T3D4_STRCW|nr:beta-N-acetylglucosaminidase domain-containing protein [Streptomyces chromofuscus]QOV43170.1 beta-N-acetylglucosaminidase domain-containing protein [Streptomyces chromofuscus]GGT32870.1 beta-N-acetylglucosaminidase [Streptomyces chromofuscus]